MLSVLAVILVIVLGPTMATVGVVLYLDSTVGPVVGVAVIAAGASAVALVALVNCWTVCVADWCFWSTRVPCHQLVMQAYTLAGMAVAAAGCGVWFGAGRQAAGVPLFVTGVWVAGVGTAVSFAAGLIDKIMDAFD